MALKYHPDKNQNTPEATERVRHNSLLLFKLLKNIERLYIAKYCNEFVCLRIAQSVCLCVCVPCTVTGNENIQKDGNWLERWHLMCNSETSFEVKRLNVKATRRLSNGQTKDISWLWLEDRTKYGVEQAMGKLGANPARNGVFWRVLRS